MRLTHQSTIICFLLLNTSFLWGNSPDNYVSPAIATEWSHQGLAKVERLKGIADDLKTVIEHKKEIRILFALMPLNSPEKNCYSSKWMFVEEEKQIVAAIKVLEDARNYFKAGKQEMILSHFNNAEKRFSEALTMLAEVRELLGTCPSKNVRGEIR